ncbi:UNVERIFIED_CONTAM: hypothetical protein Scaly_2636400 [Sesamum calycinum]|uniref:Uncharacterized protein n=1 Tax=Sesamum calycinum TaxID=2727403 RepID=A0AAW2JAD9_9LAMI
MPYLEVLNLERFRPTLKSWFHSRQTYAQPNSMGLSFWSVAFRCDIEIPFNVSGELESNPRLSRLDEDFENKLSNKLNRHPHLPSQVEEKFQQMEACGICNSIGHPTNLCPMLQEETIKQPNIIGGLFVPSYDPHSNKYNPGWTDYPNLGYVTEPQTWSPPQSNSKPGRLAKKKEGEKEKLETICTVVANIPLVNTIKRIPHYAEFLKALCTNKCKLKDFGDS